MSDRNLLRTHEMAATLLRGHKEAHLDLDDECLLDDWLRAAMYTDGQICLYGRAAIESARAALQTKNPAKCAAAESP
jgi:hypothetical protein